MPIGLDFPEITDAFRRFLLMPVRQMAHSFEAIALWLTRRVKTADMLEQLSRSVPVIDFTGDSVTLWLDAQQAHALTPDAAHQRLIDAAGQGARKRVGGLGLTRQMIEQDLILPSALGTLAAAVRVIGDSVDRFTQLKPAEMGEILFAHSGVNSADKQRRRAGDLWGEAVLGWKLLASSMDQLRGAKALVTGLLPKSKDNAASAPAAASGDGGTADTLQDVGRIILGAILTLTLIKPLAVAFWQGFVSRLKHGVIDLFDSFEDKINGYRFLVLNFVFGDFRKILRMALSFVGAAQLVLIANLRFFSDFALFYGELILDELDTWLTAVVDYVNLIIAVINALLTAINDFLQTDIKPLIVAALAPVLPGAATAILTALPSITLDDLITAGTNLGRAGARVAFSAWSEGLSLAVKAVTLGGLLLPDSVENRLDAVPSLFWNLLRKPPAYTAETAPLAFPPGVHFPDLYKTIFVPGIADFRKALVGITDTVPAAARDILGAGSKALGNLADTFSDAAANVNSAGFAARLRGVVAMSMGTADKFFGPDAAALRAEIAAKQADPVAAALEKGFAGGGFFALTDAIPAYFHAMQETWQAQPAPAEETAVLIDKTSPHILAARAVLARSHLKQIVVKAGGLMADRGLAATVASRFRAAVQQAYLDGEAQLKLFAAAPG
jgi:hypothetical protein